MQTAGVVAAATLPYVPTTQAVHPEVPVARALNEPVTHAVHPNEVDAEARLPYRPTPQAVHTSEVDEAAKLPYAPPAQDVHADAPVGRTL